jgi:hypothetical protein
MQYAFLLTDPGETIRGEADVAYGCGQPPARRYQVEAYSRFCLEYMLQTICR